MSCCGKKRQALNSLSSGPTKKVDEGGGEGPIPLGRSNATQASARFRYTGITSLEVEGVLNHRVYSFSTRTPELTVLTEDVAIMRGYRELVELKG
jgi:hypothetical protein